MKANQFTSVLVNLLPLLGLGAIAHPMAAGVQTPGERDYHCDPDGAASSPPGKRQTEPPPDLGSRGYLQFDNGVQPDGIHKWSIASRSAPAFTIDEVGYAPGVGQPVVYAALNQYDITPAKLYLSDLVVGWWGERSGMAVGDMGSVCLRTVVEQGAKDATAKAYALMGRDPGEDLDVYAGSDDPPMAEAFDGLMKTKFGSGFTTMLQKYAAFQSPKPRSIVAFHLTKKRGGNPDMVMVWA